MTRAAAMREHRGYAAVGLFQPKTPANVGSALRACGCFGAAMLVVQGQRYRKACTDTQAEYRRTPLLQVDDLLSVIPYDCVPIAVEISDGAESIYDFKHPARAYYLFGPEDGSLPRSVQARCARTVYIPTAYCMNLAVTVGVVLYDRRRQQGQESKP